MAQAPYTPDFDALRNLKGIIRSLNKIEDRNGGNPRVRVLVLDGEKHLDLVDHHIDTAKVRLIRASYPKRATFKLLEVEGVHRG